MPETPKPPPSLSDLPTPFPIPEKATKPEGPEDLINRLPQELRDPTTNFVNKLARTFFSQQSSADGSARVSADQLKFYEERFNEILDSGLLNPNGTPKKIS